MAKKKVAPKVDPAPKVEELDRMQQEVLQLGHLIKYNLYLLSKTLIFSSLVSNSFSPEDAVDKTNEIINELDLDTKQRLEKAKAQ